MQVADTEDARAGPKSQIAYRGASETSMDTKHRGMPFGVLAKSHSRACEIARRSSSPRCRLIILQCIAIMVVISRDSSCRG
jgi:hypothetical protein